MPASPRLSLSLWKITSLSCAIEGAKQDSRLRVHTDYLRAAGKRREVICLAVFSPQLVVATDKLVGTGAKAHAVAW